MRPEDAPAGIARQPAPASSSGIISLLKSREAVSRGSMLAAIFATALLAPGFVAGAPIPAPSAWTADRQVAARLGRAGEEAGLKKLGYPRTKVPDAVGAFWLTDPDFAVSTREQLVFTRRFYTEPLPVDAAYLDAVRKMTVRTSVPDKRHRRVRRTSHVFRPPRRSAPAPP